MSREYALVAVAFDLSDDDVRELVTASVRQAFITDAHDDAFAHEGLRLKRRVMRGVANWRGFPGGTRCSAKSADGIASQLMRRIARLGNVLSESLSRSASPTPKDGVKYAADDDDDEALIHSSTRELRLGSHLQCSSGDRRRAWDSACAARVFRVKNAYLLVY